MLKDTIEWYFRPRRFETGRVYPLLGVRLYKKYLPTSGDLITRRRGIKRLQVVEAGGRGAALRNYDRQARRWEGRHLISGVVLQAWAVVGGILVSPTQFWACTAINLVVNIYPVMLQRYNRARISGLLGTRQRPNNSFKPKPLRGSA